MHNYLNRYTKEIQKNEISRCNNKKKNSKYKYYVNLHNIFLKNRSIKVVNVFFLKTYKIYNLNF